MGYSKLHLLFSPIIVLYVLHLVNAAQILDERVSLLSFMSGITGDPEHALTNWNSSGLPLCKWSGVGCDMHRNRVVELNLSHKSLRGTISPALFDLSQLEILDLSGNFFEGRIPPEIGALYQLKELSLSSNLLQGNIPSEVGLLKELVYLNLGSNKLVGEIPASLFCNGSSSLQYLDLSNNTLNGAIPLHNECALAELRYLLLWSNRLVGEVPLPLRNSSKLEWLDLESNQLEGELPSKILNNMPHLKFLYLSYNHFSSHNSNTNLVPFFASLLNSSNLQEIDLAGNYLGGELPPIIGDLSALVQINLDTNLIYGPIPPQISNLVNLTLLNLSSNLLNGSVPSELCRMAKLERLYLSNNSLSGHIPSAFGDMPHLGLLDLSKNMLSGTIPDSFANLVQLRRLLLYENHLSGTIPPSLGKCINLEILDLSHNRISGTIPSEVAGLNSLKLYLNLSSNLLTGHIPLELSKMDMVLAIDLSNNNLSGALPSQLGSCIALESLNLSRNSLEGQFPEAIGSSLPYLRELDVAFNQFSGEIPQSLMASASLKMLNFSYNNFCGNITNKGSFSSLTVDSFLGNDRLCGSIEGLRRCHRKPTRHFLIAILLSLLITPIFCVVGYPIVLRSKLRRKLPVLNGKTVDVVDEEAAREEIKYPRISRRQLVEATGGFSSSSLIGSGRFGQVYKGVLEDNTAIAVKVLNSKTAGEILGSFKRECQVLKRTRHRNLIRIITACSRPDFKALVLPLMPNGSLENHLYPTKHGTKRGLDLVQLISICSDVAQGMAYLHHYAPVKVVHCDLKPSNILLDHDLTALVTDFGIARLVKGANEAAPVDDSASYDSTDGLLCGSVGYIAPGN